jgi:hypothetical protein
MRSSAALDTRRSRAISGASTSTEVAIEARRAFTLSFDALAAARVREPNAAGCT